MSSKKRKMSSKSSRASEEASQNYDHDKFINESAVKKASSLEITPSLRRRDFNIPTIFSGKPLRGRVGVHCANPRNQLLQCLYGNFMPT